MTGIRRAIGRFPGVARTSGDTVTIGFGSNSNTFTVTEDAASASASTLKIDGDTQGGSNPVTLSMVGNTLTVATTVFSTTTSR